MLYLLVLVTIFHYIELRSLPVILCEATFGINQDNPPCRMILCSVSTFDAVSFSCEEEVL